MMVRQTVDAHNDKAYVIERMYAGEWTRWSGGPETRDFCDRFILAMVAQAKDDETSANIDNWRTVRAYPLKIKSL